MMQIQNLTQRIVNGGSLSEEEAMFLTQMENPQPLYDAAHKVSKAFNQNKFDTCSIINVKSGMCPENCKWCAQSAHYHTGADVYGALGVKECVEQAEFNRKQGIGRFSLVASGRRPSDKDIRQYALSYRQIRKEVPGMKLCASLGLCTEEQLSELYDAGVTTYHCNMETAPSYFAHLCTTHTQADKMKTLQAARKVGMRICSGGIIGMGESMEQRIELAFYMREIGALSIPINVLQPIAGTPLEKRSPLSEQEFLMTVALFRLINPKAFLRFSGGRMQLSPDLQRKAIYAGINAAITGDLLTTVGCTTPQDMKMIEEMQMVNTNDTDWEVAYDH